MCQNLNTVTVLRMSAMVSTVVVHVRLGDTQALQARQARCKHSALCSTLLIYLRAARIILRFVLC